MNEEMMKSHLDWSEKQKRILTGGERAEEFYTAERGYPFEETELPHYHLLKGDTQEVFEDWNNNQAKKLAGTKRTREEEDSSVATKLISPLVGAWKRLLFFGGWEHTSIKNERTYNIQTSGLFIDLRIPRSREGVLGNSTQLKRSLKDLTKEELRCYARQHVFAGYTQITTSANNNSSNSDDDVLCTRHHCMDWNFVGVPRSRPNKWYAELSSPTDKTTAVKTWKEWAFAKDDRGQHYYVEQWERLPQGEGSPMLALRKRKEEHSQDRMILVVGDHFNFVRARDLTSLSKEKLNEYSHHSSLVGLVDAALDQDDLPTAMAYLSIQAGHGQISKGWLIDCAIEPWREGTPLWTSKDQLSVKGEKISNCQVVVNDDEVWEVFDTTFTSVDEVKSLLMSTRK